MKYYWCVDCGYHGEFKIYRQRNLNCEYCNYDAICELDEEEWTEYGKERNIIQKEQDFYKKELAKAK